ncbi:protein PHLOEM PROTEIN 2-LIKE A1-like [Amaranthus tricolor]|uniref:protein PHLOEM PROTEIN 2-LIKE A1-like n=1 Tax=Amaranthus tricolor TaxID=29722 RepID=UPI00259035BA|nr:protein PHLOEM PROTEIN 2-LIKE A1-like [Amaranthus tricolor]
MGNNLSEEQNESSQQQHQALPVHHEYYPESDQALSSQRSDVKTHHHDHHDPYHHQDHYHHVNKPKVDKRSVKSKLPHNCEAILKNNSDLPIDNSSIHKLYEQLHVGVFLNGRKMKYWVDKKGNNCFMVFANGLKITWGENPTYWYLHTEQTSDEGLITVAQLRNVAWLEVHGRFNTTYLTPGVTYQVTFLIMLEFTSYGWEVPINFRLTLPNGTKQEHKEHLQEKPKGEWLRIPVGQFRASPENIGEMEFSLYEYEGGSWKKGLILKSAIIEPRA